MYEDHDHSATRALDLSRRVPRKSTHNPLVQLWSSPPEMPTKSAAKLNTRVTSVQDRRFRNDIGLLHLREMSSDKINCINSVHSDTNTMYSNVPTSYINTGQRVTTHQSINHHTHHLPARHGVSSTPYGGTLYTHTHVKRNLHGAPGPQKRIHLDSLKVKDISVSDEKTVNISVDVNASINTPIINGHPIGFENATLDANNNNESQDTVALHNQSSTNEPHVVEPASQVWPTKDMPQTSCYGPILARKLTAVCTTDVSTPDMYPFNGTLPIQSSGKHMAPMNHSQDITFSCPMDEDPLQQSPAQEGYQPINSCATQTSPQGFTMSSSLSPPGTSPKSTTIRISNITSGSMAMKQSSGYHSYVTPPNSTSPENSTSYQCDGNQSEAMTQMCKSSESSPRQWNGGCGADIKSTSQTAGNSPNGDPISQTATNMNMFHNNLTLRETTAEPSQVNSSNGNQNSQTATNMDMFHNNHTQTDSSSAGSSQLNSLNGELTRQTAIKMEMSQNIPESSASSARPSPVHTPDGHQAYQTAGNMEMLQNNPTAWATPARLISGKTSNEEPTSQSATNTVMLQNHLTTSASFARPSPGKTPHKDPTIQTAPEQQGSLLKYVKLNVKCENNHTLISTIKEVQDWMKRIDDRMEAFELQLKGISDNLWYSNMDSAASSSTASSSTASSSAATPKSSFLSSKITRPDRRLYARSKAGKVTKTSLSKEDHMEAILHDSHWDQWQPFAGAPRLAIKLARDCIFGRQVLMKSTVTGRSCKNALDAKGLNTIKECLRRKYGSRCSRAEFEMIWKQARESLSQLCKRLRRVAKDRRRYRTGFKKVDGTNGVEPQISYDVEPQISYDVEPQISYDVEPQISYDVEPQISYDVESEDIQILDKQSQQS